MRRARSLPLLAIVLTIGSIALPARSEWSLAAGRTRRAHDLIAALGHDDATERAAAERALVALGSGVLPLLRRADAGAADLETRLRLRRAAARIETSEASPAELARRAAVRALARGRVPDRAALDTLGPDALPLLVERWKGPGNTDVELLDAAIAQAARHGGPAAGPFLVRLLGESRIPYASLIAAGAALERRAGPNELAVVRDAATRASGARRAVALRILFARGDAGDLDLIAHQLDDPDRRVRIACALLLWSPRHRDVARRLLVDRDDEVRLAAAAVLAETGRAADGDALETLLRDRSHRVRILAVEGLARRGRLDALASLDTDPSTGVRLAVERAEARRASEPR